MATTSYLINIFGPDRVGMISAVTGYLFGVGANLADTAFSVLGQGCSFTCVAELDREVDKQTLADGLKALAEMDGATVQVMAFEYGLERTERGHITHLVEMIAGDRPGLLARFSEAFMEYGVNIVRMTSRRAEMEGQGFDDYEYRTRFALNVPADRLDAIDNLIANIAGQMDLRYSVRDVSADNPA